MEANCQNDYLLIESSVVKTAGGSLGYVFLYLDYRRFVSSALHNVIYIFVFIKEVSKVPRKMKKGKKASVQSEVGVRGCTSKRRVLL